MDPQRQDFSRTLGETLREVAAAFDDLGSTLESGSRRPPFDREAEERQEALTLVDEVRNPLELVSLAILVRKAAIVHYLRGLGTLATHGSRPGEPEVFSLAPVARAPWRPRAPSAGLPIPTSTVRNGCGECAATQRTISGRELAW